MPSPHFSSGRILTTPSTTPCRAGDVVLLPFPFTDLTTTKQRPAVVVSSDEFNARQRDVIVLAITSQVSGPLGPEDCRLSPEDQQRAGLLKTSLVKCGKVLTIDQRLIRKVLGRLPAQTLTRLTRQVSELLG